MCARHNLAANNVSIGKRGRPVQFQLASGSRKMRMLKRDFSKAKKGELKGEQWVHYWTTYLFDEVIVEGRGDFTYADLATPLQDEVADEPVPIGSNTLVSPELNAVNGLDMNDNFMDTSKIIFTDEMQNVEVESNDVQSGEVLDGAMLNDEENNDVINSETAATRSPVNDLNSPLKKKKRPLGQLSQLIF